MMFQRLAAAAVRHARLLVALWLAAPAALVLLAPSLQSVATQDAAAFLPPGSPSEVAENISRQAFPTDPVRDSAIVVFERRTGPLTAVDRRFIAAQARLLSSPALSANVGVVQSAVTQPNLAPFLRSPDGRAELIIASFRQTSFSPTTVRTIGAIRHGLAHDRPPGLSAHLTGFAGLAVDQVGAIETSFRQTAILTVVLVLLILLFIYRSPVAALIPLVTIGVSFLIARALVALLADGGLSVSGQAETFMIVMVFGAGTDYCLFLVSRYREQRSNPAERQPLRRTIGLVGPVIAASGATVIVGFASQAAAKSGLYKTMGPAIAVAIAVTVLASLTLTPALLALLGRHAFWPQQPTPTGQGEQISPRWQRRAARVAAQPLVLLIAGTLLLQLPAAGLGWYHESFDLIQELPGSADAKTGYATLARHYPPGIVSPVFVLISSDHGLLGDADVRALDTVTSRLRALPGVAQVRSLSLPAGQPLTQQTLPALLGGRGGSLGSELDPNKVDVTPLYNALAAPGGMHLTGSLLRRYPQITHRLGYLLSADQHTTRLVVSLANNPYDNTSLATFGQLDDVVTSTLAGTSLTGSTVHLAGPSAFYADIRSTQDRDFRTIVAVLLAGIFAVLVLLLRSLLAPLYLLATVLLSFAASLGITVAVFQGLLGNSGLSFFLAPLLFVVLVALGADYNIFIVGRIREEIAAGLSVRDATQRGLAVTGSVITSAGLVMAGTFAGLMLSPLANLRQIGFAVSVGVLLDTFVVRTMLVPSIIMLIGPQAFWPAGLRRTGQPLRPWQIAAATASLAAFTAGLVVIAAGGNQPPPRTLVLAHADTTTVSRQQPEPIQTPTPATGALAVPHPNPSPTPTTTDRPAVTAVPTRSGPTSPAATLPRALLQPTPSGPGRIAPPTTGSWTFHVEGTRKIGAAGSTQPYTEDRSTSLSRIGGSSSDPLMQLQTSTNSESDTEQRRYTAKAVQLTYLKQTSGALSFEGTVTPAADLIRWPISDGQSWTQDFTIGGTHAHRVSHVQGSRTITLPYGSFSCTVISSSTDLTGDTQGHETDTSCWSAALGMVIDEQREQKGTYKGVSFDITSRARSTGKS
jgi:RND superfamily putative drug exporter